MTDTLYSDNFLWIRRSIDYGWFGLRCVMPAFISRLHQSSRVNMVNVNIFIRILFASHETNIEHKTCKSSFNIQNLEMQEYCQAPTHLSTQLSSAQFSSTHLRVLLLQTKYISYLATRIEVASCQWMGVASYQWIGQLATSGQGSQLLKKITKTI